MCGFVAYIGIDHHPSDRACIERMLAVIRHRGPDDEGTYQSGSVGFGFRRLAILDLSPSGHQPMSTPDGRYTIVFNGEIYNYIELKAELVGLGHQFLSTSDTEVLLHGYLEWGDACLSRLNGMWAFVIYDRLTGEIFACRDRFGMKPLYWCKTPQAILLASEIKSIRASGLYRDETNWQICARFFLEHRLDDSDETFFAGIHAVPAGTSIRISPTSANLAFKRFWQPPEQFSASTSPAKDFAEHFEQAVSIHMRSDVPVGVNLSGGLDSTAIICHIQKTRNAKHSNQEIDAFCFTAPEFDESPYIQATLEQTEAHQHVLSLGPQALWESLSKVLWYQDEPVHSLTAVVGFQLSALAAKHGIKVVLNGQGADETLAGYPSYFKDYWYSLFTTGGISITYSEILAYCATHGGQPKQLLADLLVRYVKGQLRAASFYRRLARKRQFARMHARNWFSQDFVQLLDAETPCEPQDLHSCLNRATQVNPLPLYLRVEDRNAMAHSVESRLPFLDAQLADFALRLPVEWKMHGPWNKFILREAMRGRIPENVRSRPDKMGFPTPFTRWLRNELYQPVSEVLATSALNETGIFNMEVIRCDLARHRNGEIDCAGSIFDVAQFALWRNLKPTQQL